MTAETTAKGRVLEDSVALIEQQILKVSANVSSFDVQPRKRIKVMGVTHEIDLWVTVRTAPGYELLVIFECKNWNEKIGKNDIIIFSEKIAASSAQRGYFVATGFTADARAQAKQDARMVLIEVDIAESEQFSAPKQFHFIVVNHRAMDFDMMPANKLEVDKLKPWTSTLDKINECPQLMNYNGNEVLLGGYLAQWRDKLADEATSRLPSHAMPAGSYPRTMSETREFTGSASIDGIVLSSASLKIEFDVIVVHPTLKVTIGARGTVYHLVANVNEGEIKLAVGELAPELTKPRNPVDNSNE